VLDETARLVCERGPGLVGINDIADAAGVGKQTIYRWWPSKASVIMDALVEMTDPAPDVPQHASARDELRAQLLRVAEMFRSRRGELIREVVADLQGDPMLAAEFRERFFAHRRGRAAATLVEGIERGEIRPDIDLEVTLDAFAAPLWLRLLVGHAPLDAGAVDALMDLLWPAIATG
jgi:AcrR family transcriptional regulator